MMVKKGLRNTEILRRVLKIRDMIEDIEAKKELQYIIDNI